MNGLSLSFHQLAESWSVCTVLEDKHDSYWHPRVCEQEISTFYTHPHFYLTWYSASISHWQSNAFKTDLSLPGLPPTKAPFEITSLWEKFQIRFSHWVPKSCFYEVFFDFNSQNDIPTCHFPIWASLIAVSNYLPLALVPAPCRPPELHFGMLPKHTLLAFC